MLPLILVAVGAYLLGDALLEEKKYAKGGKTQGYDDKKDESLAMKDGKISKKDLDSTHARRDDARFEERGKMAKGGMMAKGGEVKYKIIQDVSDMDDPSGAYLVVDTTNEKILAEFDFKKEAQEYLKELKTKKVADGDMMAKGGKLVGKQKNLDVNKNGKLDAEDFKMLRSKKMAKGGETKMPYKEFEETLREYEIEGGFGKTIEKGYEMYYLPNGNPYLNTKFNHRNKKKAYQQYVKMDR